MSQLTQQASRLTDVLFILFEAWFIGYLGWLLVQDWGYWSTPHYVGAVAVGLLGMLVPWQLLRVVRSPRAPAS